MNTRRCETTSGVFDISHMGQFIATGATAAAWLNRMLTNNIDKLEVGAGQYTFLLNERGGIIDDLIVYRTGRGGIPAGRECVTHGGRFRLAAEASRRTAFVLKIAARTTPAWRCKGPKVVELFQQFLGS